jgi:hypothetical protein
LGKMNVAVATHFTKGLILREQLRNLRGLPGLVFIIQLGPQLGVFGLDVRLQAASADFGFSDTSTNLTFEANSA